MSIFPTRILIATDASKEAELAARTAADLADKTSSELHVVHVLDVTSWYLAYPDTAGFDGTELEDPVRACPKSSPNRRTASQAPPDEQPEGRRGVSSSNQSGNYSEPPQGIRAIMNLWDNFPRGLLVFMASKAGHRASCLPCHTAMRLGFCGHGAFARLVFCASLEKPEIV
jgi:hypothetical protein